MEKRRSTNIPVKEENEENGKDQIGAKDKIFGSQQK